MKADFLVPLVVLERRPVPKGRWDWLRRMLVRRKPPGGIARPPQPDDGEPEPEPRGYPLWTYFVERKRPDT